MIGFETIKTAIFGIFIAFISFIFPAIIAYFSKRNAKNEIKNQTLEETLENVRRNKEIDNHVDNMDRNNAINFLQKFERKD